MKRLLIPTLGALAACAAPVADEQPDAGSLAKACWTLPDPPPGCEPPEPDPEPDPEPPPPDPWVGDYDHDSLQDSYEDTLLRRYAPRVWLDTYENRFPVNVGWLLPRSTMRYSHARCPDHLIIPWGQVTRENMIQQGHRSAHDLVTFPPWNACDHFGGYHPSSSWQGDRKDGFFLQYEDQAHAGVVDQLQWVIYGHAYRTSAGDIALQYWQLYSFNDSAASANHEGDWEYTEVTLGPDETVGSVVYYRHGRRNAHNPEQIEWIDGTHHVTYSAKGGHGQYRAPDVAGGQGECLGDGMWDEAQGFADNCSQGWRWDTWAWDTGGIVNVGEKHRPFPGSEWLLYSGFWGEIGAAADVVGFTSGPRGPAYQDSWLAE